MNKHLTNPSEEINLGSLLFIYVVLFHLLFTCVGVSHSPVWLQAHYVTEDDLELLFLKKKKNHNFIFKHVYVQGRRCVLVSTVPGCGRWGRAPWSLSYK